MAREVLTRQQKAFLEECLLEFSDRYTNADAEYKKVYDDNVPIPPIMYPWHGRQKLTPYRDRNRSGYRDYRFVHSSKRRYDDDSRDYENCKKESYNFYHPY